MTNLTGANSAGSDFTALFPRYLNIRKFILICPLDSESGIDKTNINAGRGGYVAAVLSFACVPWKLLSSSNNFLAYVGAYSVFLSAFVGPYFCDYFIVRRGHLAVDQLYSNKSSDLYWGLGGFGINAYVGYLWVFFISCLFSRRNLTIFTQMRIDIQYRWCCRSDGCIDTDWCLVLV
jgi:cytosine/uracil/thiamine/allantoin permease